MINDLESSYNMVVPVVLSSLVCFSEGKKDFDEEWCPSRRTYSRRILIIELYALETGKRHKLEGSFTRKPQREAI